MGVNDKGLIEIGSFVKGDSPDFAGSIVVGNGTSSFNRTTYYLDNEFARKEITWTWDGNDPKGESTFLVTEANGSYFGELGLGSSDTLGSDLWTRDTSAIGSKLSTYEIAIYFNWRFRRF